MDADTLTIHLPPPVRAALRRFAAREGVTEEEAVARAVVRVAPPEPDAASSSDGSALDEPVRPGEALDDEHPPGALPFDESIRPGSLLDRARDIVGSYDGSPDLSTNPKYMEGFGE